MFGPVKFEINQRYSKISKKKLSECILSFANTQNGKILIWYNMKMIRLSSCDFIVIMTSKKIYLSRTGLF